MRSQRVQPRHVGFGRLLHCAASGQVGAGFGQRGI
jgi:hypothetical protein